jgi:hypothetical protein
MDLRGTEVKELHLELMCIQNSIEITGMQSLERKEIKMPTKKKSKSTVNSAGNYTKPTLRKRLFEKVKRGTKGGKAGQWSARKAQLLAKLYKAAGGGYK